MDDGSEATQTETMSTTQGVNSSAWGLTLKTIGAAGVQ